MSLWVVLPAEPPSGAVHVALGNYVSFAQPAVPAKTIKTEIAASVDGKEIAAGSVLALAVATSDKAQAWCVLPAGVAANRPKLIGNEWGGSLFLKFFRTAWGGSTRCLADSDGDGALDTQLDGKFDSLGLPSVRRLTRPVPLPSPIRFTPSDPKLVEGFSVAATVIYSDVSTTKAHQCLSLVPREIKQARKEVEKRFSVVTLVKQDGTECFSIGEARFKSIEHGDLGVPPGSRLTISGAELVLDRIDQDSIDIRMVSLFKPYLIGARTEREFEID